MLKMKNFLYIMLIVSILAIATASTAFASGDKVRGENGAGAVVQVQVKDPPPFQP